MIISNIELSLQNLIIKGGKNEKNLVPLLLVILFLFTQPVLAKSKIKKAKVLASIGKDYAAKSLLNQAIIDDPLNAELHFEAGIIFLNLESYKNFRLGMENSCRFDEKYCYKAGEVYYALGFNKIDGRGLVDSSTRYFRKAFKFNKTKRQEATRRLFASGNEYLAKGEIRRAKKYYEVTLNLEPMFRNNVAESFFEYGKKASPMEALKIFQDAVSYSDVYKKEAGRALAEKIKNGKATKLEKSYIKDWVQKWAGEVETKKLLPSDYQVYHPGTYTFNLKAGETTDHWIKFPEGERGNYALSSKNYRYIVTYIEGDSYKCWEIDSFPEKRRIIFKITSISGNPIKLKVY